MGESQMTKPLFVYVNWSESGDFEEKSLMSFQDFESKCYEITKDWEYPRGYDKTSITVLFSNGDEYKARVDLNHNCRGFKQHAESLIGFRNRCREEGKKLSNNMTECEDFLETVTF